MIILVDPNEVGTSPKTIEALKRHFTSVVISKKPMGFDLQIPLQDGSILAIERKSPADFLASIGDNRLKQQIEKMHSKAKFSAIVVTGKINYAGNGYVKLDEDQETRKWKSVSVRGMIRAIQLSGTILEWCPASLFPQMVEEIYTTCNTEDHRQGLQKHRVITFPPLDDRIQILGQFCGVGIESAKSLLKFAGMMDKNADEEGYGTLASALHWMTILSQIDSKSRPKNWAGKPGATKILENRKLLGLAADEYLAVLKETSNSEPF